VAFLALAVCSNASAEELVLPPSSQLAGVPACVSAPRLRAVQFDSKREDRSFALFSGSARPQPLRRGAHVGPFVIDRIERGAVVLATRSQRCSLKLQGEPVSRERGVVSADAVRDGLRARRPASALRSAAASSSESRSEGIAMR